MKRAAVLILAVLAACLCAVSDPGPATDASTQAQDLIRFGKEDLAHGLATSALVYFSEALQLEPGSADAWDGKARALEKLTRYDEARTASQMASQLAPDNKFVWATDGKILFDQKQFNEALISFNKSITLGNSDTTVWRWKGQTLDSLGRHEEALNAYVKATPPVEHYRGGITTVTKGGPTARELQPEDTDTSGGRPHSALGEDYPGYYEEYEQDQPPTPPVAAYDNNSYGQEGYYYDGYAYSNGERSSRRHHPRTEDGSGRGPRPVAPRTVAPYRGVVPLYQQSVVPQNWQGVVPPYQQGVEPDYHGAAGDPIMGDQNNGASPNSTHDGHHGRRARRGH